MKCHACGELGEARGPFGVICAPCWRSIALFIRRLLGRPSRWEDVWPV